MTNEIANIYETKPQTQISVMQNASKSREVAEIQGAMAIAKAYPRDPRASVDRILTCCQRKTLAESATYQYARGGTDISGPSIRLAEAIAREWGNLQFGVRELEQRSGESTVEAYALDLETNVRCVKVFQVKHERGTKKGNYALTDSRDIYELVANQGARRMRACILGVIPGDVVDLAVAQCDETLRAQCDPTPERIKGMIDAFASFGVTKDMLEKRIQRKMDSITPAQILSLRKIHNSLKDGMSSASEWFEDIKQVEAKTIKRGAPIAPVAPESEQVASEDEVEA